ncbi:hypothetical protein V6N13_008712 [Hibiscus sabdariffa]
MHLLDKRSTHALPVALMIHDNSTDRTANVPATHHSNFYPINFRFRRGSLRNGCHIQGRQQLRCSGPHPRYTDVFNKSIALADRPGTTRERVIKHQREEVWSLHCAPSPPCPGDTGTRVPVAKRTTPGVNYAKESE